MWRVKKGESSHFSGYGKLNMTDTAKRGLAVQERFTVRGVNSNSHLNSLLNRPDSSQIVQLVAAGINLQQSLAII